MNQYCIVLLACMCIIRLHGVGNPITTHLFCGSQISWTHDSNPSQALCNESIIGNYMPQAVLSRALVQCAKLILCCVLHSPLPVSWKFQLSLAHFKSIASPPLLWRSTPTVTCLLALVLSNLSSAVNCRFLTSYRVCFSILPPPCSGNSNHHLLV